MEGEWGRHLSGRSEADSHGAAVVLNAAVRARKNSASLRCRRWVVRLSPGPKPGLWSSRHSASLDYYRSLATEDGCFEERRGSAIGGTRRRPPQAGGYLCGGGPSCPGTGPPMLTMMKLAPAVGGAGLRERSSSPCPRGHR